MIAGAVISGAYFGDKMSPLSDTTNLAPAMAGTDLFTHIKYMTITTVPTIVITLIIFTILSLTQKTAGTADISELLTVMDSTLNINPWLFLVPAVVILMIVLKTKPIIALVAGVVLALVFAFIFQKETVANLDQSTATAIFKMVFTETQIVTSNDTLNDLFTAKGMMGMLWTIALILSAMVFGGAMDGIGALARITKELLELAQSVFGLFLTTVASCLGLNIIASDQYLALVVPGKMFKQAYEDKGLAPENLSRTLEDSGTVTSVLVPWNTCGAYQSTTLGVSVADYFIYAIFNWLSPIVTLIIAGLGIKIRQIAKS
jgi:NhaC family Na+:H+ antiporter